jgi:hypothetical protein
MTPTATADSVGAGPDAPQKVTLHFLAVGGAPQMRQTRFLIDGFSPFAAVSHLMRAYGGPPALLCGARICDF